MAMSRFIGSSDKSTRSSSPSSITSDVPPTPAPIVLGVCAMDVKARSRAMREIIIRLVERTRGAIEVKVFGDKVILDEDVENWPRCDVLISFFSTDFPLDKAISLCSGTGASLGQFWTISRCQHRQGLKFPGMVARKSTMSFENS